MKTHIDNSIFGSIKIEGEYYKHDILIRLDGEISKRKKKLSKAVYGTSHQLSIAEAKHIFECGAESIIYGTGHFGRSGLSPDAEVYFKEKSCKVHLLKTPKAIKAWNKAEGKVIGLFHITC
jgi:hypothetical protein